MLSLLSTLLTPLAQVPGESFWMPPSAARTASEVDTVYSFLLWLSVFFFGLITVLLVFFSVRYRKRKGVMPKAAPSHNTTLELVWSGIPLIIVLVLFYWGFSVYMESVTPPQNAFEVDVYVNNYTWSFRYDNGYEDSVLHLPPGVPVALRLSSGDYIHSLFIPAFRVKKDVVPGRVNRTWFIADMPGLYDLMCAEYCGEKHSLMYTVVNVHPTAEAFDAWLTEAAELANALPPAQKGERLYERLCQSCHTRDGSDNTGPTFLGLYDRAEEYFMDAPPIDGEPLNGVDEYIRQSILSPQAYIVEGYETVAMNSFLGQTDDDDIRNLTAYIRTLRSSE